MPGIVEPDIDNPEAGKIYYHYYIDDKCVEHSRGVYYGLQIGDFISPSWLGRGIYKVLNIVERTDLKLINDGYIREIHVRLVNDEEYKFLEDNQYL